MESYHRFALKIMSSPSPIAAGFSLVFRRPSLIFAEIAWRWSFAAAAWFLGAMFLIAYAGSVPVNTLDSVMWHSGQPALIGRALRHILAGSGFRFTIGGILLALCLLVGWIVLASLGRVAIVRNAANELGVSTHSDRGRVRPLLLLNFLRAAVALAAIVALVGSVLLASSYWASTHVRAGEAGRMVTLLWFLIWGCWISLNWVLSFASLFAPVEGGVAVAFATVARLLADKTGAVFLIGVVFGICHFGIFVAGCGAGLMELGLLGTSVAPAVVLLEILTGAAYCAVADFLYTGRMVAYLSLLRREEPQARVRETSARRSPEAGSIDKGEVILSDVPLLPA